MSVTDETKAIAPEAATVPAEAEPTKELEKAVDAPVDEKKEEETKVSLSWRRRAIPPGANHLHRHCFIVLSDQPVGPSTRDIYSKIDCIPCSKQHCITLF